MFNHQEPHPFRVDALLRQKPHHAFHLPRTERRLPRILSSTHNLLFKHRARARHHLERLRARDTDGLEVFVLANHRLLLGETIDSLHALTPGTQAGLGDGTRTSSRAFRERRTLERGLDSGEHDDAGADV